MRIPAKSVTSRTPSAFFSHDSSNLSDLQCIVDAGQDGPDYVTAGGCKGVVSVLSGFFWGALGLETAIDYSSVLKMLVGELCLNPT